MNTLKFTPAIKAFALLFTLLAMFSQTASAIGVCSSINTNSGVSIPVGQSPRQVLLGDLNADNLQDAVVITGGFSSNGTANVLLNTGGGNLSAFTTILVNNTTIGAAALDDFNLDGALDLIIAGASSSSSATTPLNVYLGNGNGTFSAPSTTFFQGAANAVTTGDFNRDGLPDIALANTGNNSFGAVLLFLNSGFGSFTFAGTFPITSSPRDLRNADLNGDNILDIITANFNGTASVLLGNEAGGFQTAVSFNLFSNNSSSSSGISFAVGDVNNDGRPDIAAANGDSSSFTVLLNNGNGTFAAPVTNTFADFNLRPRSIVIGQFTGDANADIAVSVSGGFSDSVSAAVIVPGFGSAAFNVSSLTIAATSSNPLFITAGDLNGDNRNDLITANNSSGDVSVLLNNGADRYGAITVSTNGAPNQIVVGDFNADGNLDTAVSNPQSSSGSGSNGIVVSYGDGAGGVTTTSGISVAGAQSLFADDLNSDSKTDLIAVTGNQLYVYLNSGNLLGNPPNTTVNLNFSPRMVVAGDFNSDGKKDIVISIFNGNSIALLLGQGNGTFGQPVILASPVFNPFLSVADFNNDGKSDLAFSGNGFNGTGGVYILLGTGAGTFTQVSEVINVNSPGAHVSSDLNNDGKTDIAVISSNNFSGGGFITVAFGDGDGTFSPPVNYSTAFVASALTAADFNGDDLPDLAYSVRSSNSYSVLLNTGRSSFRNSGSFLAGIFPESIAAGDFNNDGRSDFVTANRGGNNFSLLINNCREAVTKTDYTGEGRTDFAVFRPSNATWYVRDANGTVKSRQLGLEGDIPMPGDYDGDGTTDFAVFRPSNSTWYIGRSSNNLSYSVKWGTTGDIPTAIDFDGDGRTDIAVFRPSNGVWYIIRSTNPGDFYAVQFGAAGDRPVSADYDGDGRADFAVFRPSNGVWYLLKSREGFSAAQFGISTDRTVPGDYDGDGRTDIAVYRDGVWFILLSENNSLRVENFGLATDVPQPGDYDGDGKTDIAVYRPNGNNWYVIQSSDRTFKSVVFGSPNDIPVSSIHRY